MQLQDQFEQAYTAESIKSVNRFSLALESYLGHRNDTMPLLEATLKDEPLPMALIMRAYLLKLASDPRFTGVVNGIITQLEDMQLNPRETGHLLVLKQLAAGGDGVKEIELLLSTYPHDILAIRVAHYLHFYHSGPTAMRDSLQRTLDHWQNGDPYYGYLMGMYSFGLEEAGDYDAAEEHGRQAIDYHQQDVWAAHAVAHVFQMNDRFDEGVSWIEKLTPGWDNANNFRYHLYWHNALFYIGRAQPEQALAIYDNTLVHALKDDFYLDACNAAALLWRLKMLGLAVDDRFEALQELSARRVADNELIFSSLHYLMAPALMGDQSAVDQCLAAIRQWSQEETAQGLVCNKVGLPLAEAIVDLSAGQYDNAAKSLAELADDIYLIGGSDAQRHLFTQMQEYAASQRV